MEEEKPSYIIATDVWDRTSTYCYLLVKITDGCFEVLEDSLIRDKNDFKDRVQKLSKLYNAKIYE